MREEEVIKSLEAEGYQKVWSYDAEPNEVDEEHSHDYDTKLYVISGEIRIKSLIAGIIQDYSLKEGDSLEISRDQPHSAKVGPEGCRYIVAERV